VIFDGIDAGGACQALAEEAVFLGVNVDIPCGS